MYDLIFTWFFIQSCICKYYCKRWQDWPKCCFWFDIPLGIYQLWHNQKLVSRSKGIKCLWCCRSKLRELEIICNHYLVDKLKKKNGERWKSESRGEMRNSSEMICNVGSEWFGGGGSWCGDETEHKKIYGLGLNGWRILLDRTFH